MASFTQCPILFTLMLLPAITHAAVVEVDSKGVAVLEANKKLVRKKGEEDTPALTEVERYPDSEGEPDLPSAEEQAPLVSYSNEDEEADIDGDDSASPSKGDFHFFSGTDCFNCQMPDCAPITVGQCILLNRVFGSVWAKHKYEEPIKAILKKLWKVGFQCTGNVRKAAFRWTRKGCIIDCGSTNYGIDWNRYKLGKEYNDAYADANDAGKWAKQLEALAKAGKGMLCKKRAIWSPQAHPLEAENPFKDMAKPVSSGFPTPAKRAKQKDLDNFLADPYCDDYSIKIYKTQRQGGSVWEKLTDEEKDQSEMDDDEKKGWAVRETIKYLRTQTETTASTCDEGE